jgi:alkylated DNA repair dioxygenase AlkB
MLKWTKINRPKQHLVPKKDFEATDWCYYDRAIDSTYFGRICDDIIPMLQSNFSRKSCLFGKNSSDDGSGYSVSSYTWEQAPKCLSEIRDKAEKITGHSLDYCLVHLYQDGNSTIGWHNDEEALDSPVVSVSLGASRKFRFKKLGQTSGYTYQYILNSGDILVMKDTCQRKWLHTVPTESTVSKPRINLTFRKL